MAKLSLNNHQTQPENPLAWAILGSVGFLVCLVVSVMGIKLWWFKHRLSFEQTTIQNGAAGGNPPTVVAQRRQKKSRFSKDKRLSQQVYSSVDVHGVFKQKTEDDLDIQQPAQLPPVRLRQAGNAQSLLLAPPRNKRRPQYVQSTAFEELGDIYEPEVAATPKLFQQESLSNRSSGVAYEKDQGISLTFEEVEKELKPLNYVAPTNVAPTMEAVPEPPKRLNRSSSTSVKLQRNQEKSHHFLKCSQSVSVPEFRKVIERRPTGFHRPTEDDLTRIDDLEEPQFEKFGDRRPTGYIKYEEVDFQADLRDFRVLNLKRESQSYEEIKLFYDSGHLGNPNVEEEPLEALRNEEIIYQNPASPDIADINKAIEDYEKSSEYSKKKEEYSQYNDLSKTSSKGFSYTEERGSRRTRAKDELDGFEKNDFENYGNEKISKPRIMAAKDTSNTKEHTSERTNIPPHLFKKETKNFSQSEPLSYNQDIETLNENHSDHRCDLNLVKNEELQNFKKSPDLNPRIVIFDKNCNDTDYMDKSTLNQRRPTAYVRIHPSWESEQKSEYCAHQNYKQTSQSSPCHELHSSEIDTTIESLKLTYVTELNPNTVEEKSTLKQQGPTEFLKSEVSPSNEVGINSPAVIVDDNSQPLEGHEDKFTLNQRTPTTYAKSKPQQKEGEELVPPTVSFVLNTAAEGDEEKSTLNQRRPTAFIRSKQEEFKEQDHNPSVKFNLGHKSSNVEETEEKFTLNQRRPTEFIPSKEKDFEELGNTSTVTFDLVNKSRNVEETEEKFTLNQRRPTEFIRSKEEDFTELNHNSMVTFELGNKSGNADGNEEKFTLNQRRPTGFISARQDQNDVKEENIHEEEITSFPEKDDSHKIYVNTQGSANNTQYPDTIENNLSFINIAEAREPCEKLDSSVSPLKKEQFNNSSVILATFNNSNENELLPPQRPTAFVRKSKIVANDTDTIWQELEKDIEMDFTQNIEEEFARIRQSFELNEADFLEIKTELQLSSPTLYSPEIQSSFSTEEPNGFGKTIEDDWENFEKLKKLDNKTESVQDHQEIRITYDALCTDHDIATVSILKETKIHQDTQMAGKPRKSKVTFDSKTEEHLIPARISPSDEEDTEDYYESEDDDDIYNKPAPPIPMQRLTSLTYADDHFYEPVVAPPTTISLIGSQLSQEPQVEAEMVDSWSAIRKHRHLTSQFQHLTLDSPTSPPPPSHPPPPLPAVKSMEALPAPKPAYRNPLAQLAVDRAREVRSEMEGFKSRFIKDAKKMQAKRSSQEVLNLSDNFEDTEA